MKPIYKTDKKHSIFGDWFRKWVKFIAGQNYVHTKSYEFIIKQQKYVSNIAMKWFTYISSYYLFQEYIFPSV